MTGDLFEGYDHQRVLLADGAWVLPRFAEPEATELQQTIEGVIDQAPLRHMETPGGFTMSAAMTNCGSLGWVSDRTGYRYQPVDPLSGKPWPAMPALFRDLAVRAAADAGYNGFQPDACLINRYQPGSKMSLHQDRNEQDFNQPIVSVSLGLPMVFLFGGMHRRDRTQRVPLVHGDVVVWGGPSRLRYHGVLPLKPGHHPLVGEYRFNLTFRRAG